MVKGCSVVEKGVGLDLLREYETLRESGSLTGLRSLRSPGMGSLQASEARGWLARKVSHGRLCG